MSPVPLPTRVFLACGMTDMRKGFDGLAVLVQQVLAQNRKRVVEAADYAACAIG